MQFTKEQCDNQITKLQQEIPQKQNELQQLLGYRQALLEMEEDEFQNKEKTLTE
tara:strand:+ start:558 stop:719 length:162 start_codon:yes stop_codon:yes gene_type:complete